MAEENAYILGTDQNELLRLGLQHQVWASEAQKGWELANFQNGQVILDLGSGPGYCARELAYIVGEKGKVIAVDQSQAYIEHIRQLNQFYGLKIDAVCSSFDSMTLNDNSLDGMYSRWSLAWTSNPQEVLEKITRALKPGGRMLIQEYYDWKTHQTFPQMPALKKAIAAALKSFKDSGGEIDIGRELPGMLTQLGMKLINLRPMSKVVRPNDFAWQWPKSFYHTYFPMLVDQGHLTHSGLNAALSDMEVLAEKSNATLFCPMMIEIIAEK